jgi:hypothetical protein
MHGHALDAEAERALNRGGPRHAFETKDHVHRDGRLRGDVGGKPGTGFNLGEW